MTIESVPHPSIGAPLGAGQIPRENHYCSFWKHFILYTVYCEVGHLKLYFSLLNWFDFVRYIAGPNLVQLLL